MRTTFITGFPGETDADFDELVEFVGEQQFERLGVFTYSLEPDTPAAKLPDHVPEEVKNERRDQLMAVQQEVAFEWNDAQVGRRLDVLIDSAVPEEKNAWIGRSYADAPDVDGVVYVTGEKLSAGALVPCEIVGYSDYDLVAAAVGEPAKDSRLILGRYAGSGILNEIKFLLPGRDRRAIWSATAMACHL